MTSLIRIGFFTSLLDEISALVNLVWGGSRALRGMDAVFSIMKKKFIRGTQKAWMVTFGIVAAT